MASTGLTGVDTTAPNAVPPHHSGIDRPICLRGVGGLARQLSTLTHWTGEWKEPVIANNCELGRTFEGYLLAERGVLAQSNAELVESIARITKSRGAASSGDARQILGPK